LAEGLPHASAEFRTRGRGFLVDFAELTGGPSNWVYPQRELVADLTETLLEAGAPIRFGVEAVGVELGQHPRVRGRDSRGKQVLVDCDFVAGCDGFHGVSRACLPTGALEVFERRYDIQWLVIMAAVPPTANHAVYALHPRGFAAYLLRAPDQTRFMLQIAADSAVDDWPDHLVWSELRTRLAKEGGR
jgi:p-hydroxybenzoate 3-monooxygenase